MDGARGGHRGHPRWLLQPSKRSRLRTVRARTRPSDWEYTPGPMSERRDIPDALRDAVERTVQATVGTRELAQGAASELSSSVDELVKGAEKGITRSGRTVRAAVEERLPATQEDVKAIRAELRRLAKRLHAGGERLAA